MDFLEKEDQIDVEKCVGLIKINTLSEELKRSLLVLIRYWPLKKEQVIEKLLVEHQVFLLNDILKFMEKRAKILNSKYIMSRIAVYERVVLKILSYLEFEFEKSTINKDKTIRNQYGYFHQDPNRKIHHLFQNRYTYENTVFPTSKSVKIGRDEGDFSRYSFNKMCKNIRGLFSGNKFPVLLKELSITSDFLDILFSIPFEVVFDFLEILKIRFLCGNESPIFLNQKKESVLFFESFDSKFPSLRHFVFREVRESGAIRSNPWKDFEIEKFVFGVKLKEVDIVCNLSNNFDFFSCFQHVKVLSIHDCSSDCVVILNNNDLKSIGLLPSLVSLTIGCLFEDDIIPIFSYPYPKYFSKLENLIIYLPQLEPTKFLEPTVKENFHSTILTKVSFPLQDEGSFNIFKKLVSPGVTKELFLDFYRDTNFQSHDSSEVLLVFDPFVFSNLRKLEVHNGRNGDSFILILHHLLNLEKFYYYGVPFGKEISRQISINNCPKLLKIEFHSCVIREECIKTIDSINCPNLKKIGFYCCDIEELSSIFLHNNVEEIWFWKKTSFGSNSESQLQSPEVIEAMKDSKIRVIGIWRPRSSGKGKLLDAFLKVLSVSNLRKIKVHEDKYDAQWCEICRKIAHSLVYQGRFANLSKFIWTYYDWSYGRGVSRERKSVNCFFEVWRGLYRLERISESTSPPPKLSDNQLLKFAIEQNNNISTMGTTMIEDLDEEGGWDSK